MGFRQNKSRQAKSFKKALKKSDKPLMSSISESVHYLKRSIQRGDNGAAEPYSRKQIKKMIVAGEVKIKKTGKRKKKIFFKDGSQIVVSKNYKIAITYMK